MNNNQNNNINGIITPQPITPTDISNQDGNNDTNNLIQPTSIVPVEQAKEVNNNMESIQPNIISEQQIPNIIMPEMKKDNDGINNNISQTTELKLDGTSPFDIGINQTPIMASLEENNTTTPTISNSNANLNNNPNDSVQVIAPTNKEQQEDISILVSTSNNSDIVPVTKYLINMILFSIPLVGFIVLILKVVDKKDKNISNFAKAYLLLGIILVLLWIVFFGIFGATLLALGNS